MSENKKTKLENPEIFINRKEEKQYFLDYFNNVPRNILFVYGPKSTGKTTLIKKIIDEELNNTPGKKCPWGAKYDINFINLRSVLMRDFSDFKNLFFPQDLFGKSKKKLKGLKVDGKVKVPLFGEFGLEWKAEDKNMLESNLFGLMEKKLRELKRDGIKPVIILDEFQYLKNIKFNPTLPDTPDNRVIEELFKFFISITKQYNLAHVVCLTSDSYYMEELFSDTKLGNTSIFYKMEHLSKKDIFYWLEDLEKINKEIVEEIWENLGGSVWEIWQVLVSYKNTGDYKFMLNDLIDTKYGLVYMLVDEDFSKLTEKQRKEFIEVIKIIVKKGYCLKSEIRVGFELIKELVDKDIWFFDMKKGKITANSKSFEIVFKKLFKSLDKN